MSEQTKTWRKSSSSGFTMDLERGKARFVDGKLFFRTSWSKKSKEEAIASIQKQIDALKQTLVEIETVQAPTEEEQAAALKAAELVTPAPMVEHGEETGEEEPEVE